MGFRRQSFISRYKAPLIICSGALLTGLISFFVTVKVYDNSFESNLNNQLPNNVVTNLSGEKDTIIAKVDDELKNNEGKPNNEVISEGVKTKNENYEEESKIEVIEIEEEDYNEFINLSLTVEEEKKLVSHCNTMTSSFYYFY